MLIIIFLYDSEQAFVFHIIMVTDVMSTPLIVQISYLCNNKRNIRTLFKNFKFANFVRVVLNMEVKSTVKPEESKQDMQTTRV